MKIAQIGPGIMSIPPIGWGAVEMLIWDYFNILTQAGHIVDIINTKNKNEIIDSVNSKNYDAVHVHYDVFADIMPHLKAKVKILSSHYPFINDSSRWQADGYNNVIGNIVNNKDFFIFSSSQNDINTFVRNGADKDRIFLSRLGVRRSDYSFYDEPKYDKTLCFSQIVDRKRQYLIQNIDSIDFSGRIDDPKFIPRTNYLGQLERNVLNKEISKYTNFILISSMENVTPLVVKEALICGLGIVASEIVAQDLDKSKPFITVIPENLITDQEVIEYAINENKKIARSCRKEIIKYGLDNFDLHKILNEEYIPLIERLV